MLTQMTDADWEIVVEAFRAARSRRGDKGRDDRKFLQALHYFTVHNLTWRALPAEFGHWNSVWKRFWRLSQRGVFEAMLAMLAGMSGTAHLVQMVDSTIVRAHVSAAGAKGGRTGKLSVARAAGFQQNPPEVRFGWLAADLPPDRRRGQRQPQLRDPARHWPRHHPEGGTELRRLYLARLHLYFGEIRPHDLVPSIRSKALPAGDAPARDTRLSRFHLSVGDVVKRRLIH